jgi:hypothetical protein
MEDAARHRDIEAIGLEHRPVQRAAKPAPVPPSRIAPPLADVEVNQLVEKRFLEIATAGAWVCGDRDSPLGRDREPHAVGPPARAAHLQLGSPAGELTAAERGQCPQALHLLGEVESVDAVVVPSPSPSHGAQNLGAAPAEDSVVLVVERAARLGSLALLIYSAVFDIDHPGEWIVLGAIVAITSR